MARTRPAAAALGLRDRAGWGLAGVAVALLSVVVTALATVATMRVMPHEEAWLEADLHALGTLHHDTSLIGFIVHNRVAFAGTLLAASILYLWLLRGPLRRGEAWGWWCFALSAGPGTLSYLSFVTTGYADPVHALGSAGIGGMLALGLWGTWPRLAEPRGLVSVLRAGSPRDWRAWPVAARIGWLLCAAWSLATIGGGLLVIGTGMFPVFVPQDLAYMQASAETLNQINPRLVPYLSHDRSGFGGGLVAAGIAAFGVVWFALRPGARSAGRVLTGAWAVLFAGAVLIHPIVGYNSVSHLAPFLVKDLTGIIGLGLLRNARAPTGSAHEPGRRHGA